VILRFEWLSKHDLKNALCLTSPRKAFDPTRNPLNVPIVQISLYGNDDPDAHYGLGQALHQLRNSGVLIIGAGMAVHNLPDFRSTRGSGETQE
jgi:4,5-DOPA dioxygenase extradiol